MFFLRILTTYWNIHYNIKSVHTSIRLLEIYRVYFLNTVLRQTFYQKQKRYKIHIIKL